MIKREEFIKRTLYLIKKLLDSYMPEDGTLDEMVEKRDKLLKKFMK